MPYRRNPRRPLPVQLSALHLTGSIALGMWLGFVAIVLTCWLLSHFLFKEQLAPVAQAVQQLANPPAVQVQPDIPPQSPLFEQYEENLRKNEQAQRLDQARSSNRNLSNPKCQFWLQQDQNAPNEKTRAKARVFFFTAVGTRSAPIRRHRNGGRQPYGEREHQGHQHIPERIDAACGQHHDAPLTPAGVGMHELAEQGDKEDGELGVQEGHHKAFERPLTATGTVHRLVGSVATGGPGQQRLDSEPGEEGGTALLALGHVEPVRVHRRRGHAGLAIALHLLVERSLEHLQTAGCKSVSVTDFLFGAVALHIGVKR